MLPLPSRPLSVQALLLFLFLKKRNFLTYTKVERWMQTLISPSLVMNICQSCFILFPHLFFFLSILRQFPDTAHFARPYFNYTYLCKNGEHWLLNLPYPFHHSFNKYVWSACFVLSPKETVISETTCWLPLRAYSLLVRQQSDHVNA